MCSVLPLLLMLALSNQLHSTATENLVSGSGLARIKSLLVHLEDTRDLKERDAGISQASGEPYKETSGGSFGTRDSESVTPPSERTFGRLHEWAWLQLKLELKLNPKTSEISLIPP
ncbi:UNVERIFIED_CONTAM: hypothetical protein K2H54_004532 [Gekko kuhli]